MDRQKLLRIAREFGAEARANEFSQYITKADRESLIYHAQVKEWGDIPEDLRNELMTAYREGYKSESKTCI